MVILLLERETTERYELLWFQRVYQQIYIRLHQIDLVIAMLKDRSGIEVKPMVHIYDLVSIVVCKKLK